MTQQSSPAPSADNGASSIWHGARTVPQGSMITAAIGYLKLSIARRPDEWRVGWSRSEPPSPYDCTDAPEPTVGETEPISDPQEDFELRRFLTRRAEDSVHLLPLLADRPMVARPEVPLAVAASDEAKIFISTPVWVCVELMSPRRRLLELPVVQPPDTWFGPNTRQGIVAYASRTAARLDLDKLYDASHRAITQITIRNQSTSNLAVERLSVPTPHLELFASDSGKLWTPPLVAVCESPSAPLQVEIDAKLPPDLRGARRIAEAREPIERGVLRRALQVLVG